MLTDSDGDDVAAIGMELDSSSGSLGGQNESSSSQEEEETPKRRLQKKRAILAEGRKKKQKKNKKIDKHTRRLTPSPPRFTPTRHEEEEEEDGYDYAALDALADEAGGGEAEAVQASPDASLQSEIEKVTRRMALLGSGPQQPVRPEGDTRFRAALASEARSRVVRGVNNQDAVTLFYDDENFTFDDHLVRRTIYRALDSGDMPDARRIRSISVFNFTEKHFDRPGATQWYHLKQEKLDLLCSLFSALAFSCGNKERKQPPEKLNRSTAGAGKKKKKQKKPRGGDDSDAEGGGGDGDNDDPLGGGEPSTAGAEKEQDLRYIKGNDHISVFVETLVQQNRVKGFRWLVFDTEPPSDRDSLLCRGLTESLLEAEEIANDAQQQLMALANGGQTRKNGGVTTAAMAGSMKIKNAEMLEAHTVRREFHYTRFTDHNNHFMNIVKPYFTTDPCLSLNDRDDETVAAQWRQRTGDGDDDDEIASQASVLRNEKAFRDDRLFMSYDTLTDEQYRFTPFTHRAHPCNMTNLFSKEAAMINHVCDEEIEPAQCRLSSYFSNCESMILPGDALDEQAHMLLDEDQAEFRLIERFNHSVRTRCDDTNFTGFPLPDLTYQFSNFFMAQDFITRVPLPHRIGARLYTDVERDTLHTMLDGGGDAPQQMMDKPVDAQRTLFGLHHSECELTSELMLYNPQLLDPDTTRAISRTHPTRETRLKFLQNKRDEVNTRLKLILTNLSLKGRIFICPAAEEQPQMAHDTNRQHHAAKKRQAELLDSFSHPMNYTNRTGESALESHEGMRLLPYLSCSMAGPVAQSEKFALLRRLVMQQIRELRPEEKTREMRLEEERYEELYYRKKVASGYPGFFKEEIEKWRPYSNTMDSIRTQLKAAGGSIETEETFLRRNVFLRLGELNRFAYRNWSEKHFDKETGQIPTASMNEAMFDLRRMQDALAVEFHHEFFSHQQQDVSMATLGIRADMLKRPLFFQSHTAATTNEASRQRIGRQMPLYEFEMNVRPPTAFITYINSFLVDQGGIAMNFKTAMLMYFCRGHHSRWHPECNNPKLNPILCGNGMAGKSKILQLMKKICPSGVGDMVTHITDHAFNVDRDLNDILLIYEEFQNKFLGYSGQSQSKNSGAGGGNGGGGVSVGSDRDTSNFFKARLTSGRTTTFAWFDNEETGKRDVKISHASVQGNLMGASNNDFTDADLNVLSRLILISVPKSKFITLGKRPQDRTKSSMGEDREQTSEIIEQQRELMRTQFYTEKGIQSGVLGNQTYGVEMCSAIPLIHEILDRMEHHYGIATNDVRKREYVIELARLITIFYACWIGRTSPLTRYQQQDPFDASIDIGFNPLVFLEGIMPFLVVQKDMVIMALTSLSCLWYHDHQDVILEAFATKKCHLQEVRKSDFLVRRKHDAASSASSRLLENQNGANLLKKKQQKQHQQGDGVEDDDHEIDYNYIKLTGRSYNEICTSLSNALGDFQVAPSEISRLLWELGRVPLTVDTYQRVCDPVTKQWTLRLSGAQENFAERYIIERNVTDGRATIAILVHFLRKKIPRHLPCDRIDEPVDEQPTDMVEEDLFTSLRAMTIERREQLKASVSQKAQQPERELTLDEKIARIGEVQEDTRTLIVRAIEDVLQNEVLENAHEPRYAALYEHYADPVTGKNPLMRFVTADPPKSVKMTELHPEMKSWIGQTKIKDQPVVLVDKLLMLPLEAKKRGRKMIISNYNTLPPSVKQSLSIYKKQPDKLMKKRVEEYAETEAWEVDRDLDWIAAAEHMLNTGRRRLASRPDYTLYNYTPSLYAALVEKKSGEQVDVLLDYPSVDIARAISQRKRRLDDERFPDQARHPKYSGFVGSNYAQGATDVEDAFIGRPFKRQKRRAVLASQ